MNRRLHLVHLFFPNIAEAYKEVVESYDRSNPKGTWHIEVVEGVQKLYYYYFIFVIFLLTYLSSYFKLDHFYN